MLEIRSDYVMENDFLCIMLAAGNSSIFMSYILYAF
jgi:hypothetical protein